MGIGDLFTRLFFGKKDSHFFLSDEGKKSNAMKTAEGLAPIIGGNVKERDGGDEFHVTGEYMGISTRVVLNVSFGGCSVEMKTMSTDPFFMLMHDDKGRQAYESQGKNKDEWDEGEEDEQKVFVSEHCYFEGDEDEIEERKAVWAKIPEDVKNGIIAVLEQRKGVFIIGGDGKAQLDPAEAVLGRGDEVEKIKKYMDLLSSVVKGLLG